MPATKKKSSRKRTKKTITTEELPENDNSNSGSDDDDDSLDRFFDDLKDPKIRIFVDRIHPKEANGVPISGVLEEYGPPADFEEIKSETQRKHHGGRYKVRNLDERGRLSSVRTFTVQGKPRIPDDDSDVPPELKEMDIDLARVRKQTELAEAKKRLNRAVGKAEEDDDDENEMSPQDIANIIAEQQNNQQQHMVALMMEQMKQDREEARRRDEQRQREEEKREERRRQEEREWKERMIAEAQARREEEWKREQLRMKEEERRREEERKWEERKLAEERKWEDRRLEEARKREEREREIRDEQRREEQKREKERRQADEKMFNLLLGQVDASKSDPSTMMGLIMQCMEIAQMWSSKDEGEGGMVGMLNKTLQTIGSAMNQNKMQQNQATMQGQQQVPMIPGNLDSLSEDQKAQMAYDISQRVQANVANQTVNQNQRQPNVSPHAAPQGQPQIPGRGIAVNDNGSSGSRLGTPGSIAEDRASRVNEVLEVMIHEIQLRPNKVEWVEMAFNELPGDVLEGISAVDYTKGQQECLGKVFSIIQKDSDQEHLDALGSLLNPGSNPISAINNARWLMGGLAMLQKAFHAARTAQQQGTPVASTPPVNQFEDRGVSKTPPAPSGQGSSAPQEGGPQSKNPTPTEATLGEEQEFDG